MCDQSIPPMVTYPDRFCADTNFLKRPAVSFVLSSVFRHRSYHCLPTKPSSRHSLTRQSVHFSGTLRSQLSRRQQALKVLLPSASLLCASGAPQALESPGLPGNFRFVLRALTLKCPQLWGNTFSLAKFLCNLSPSLKERKIFLAVEEALGAPVSRVLKKKRKEEKNLLCLPVVLQGLISCGRKHMLRVLA